MNYSIFEALLKEKKVTVYRVSKETGISASSFTDWKNGRSVPKTDKLRLIADYFGISLDSLLGTNAAKDIEDAGFQGYKARKMVPIIGEIRAGRPIITNETLRGYEFADVDDASDYFYLSVIGDSMKNCGIINGSIVLFHKQQYAEEGQIVACLVGGECATVKRFHRKGKKILLEPENDEYKPINLSAEDFETGDARILGVAVEVKIRL